MTYCRNTVITNLHCTNLLLELSIITSRSIITLLKLLYFLLLRIILSLKDLHYNIMTMLLLRDLLLMSPAMPYNLFPGSISHDILIMLNDCHVTLPVVQLTRLTSVFGPLIFHSFYLIELTITDIL